MDWEFVGVLIGIISLVITLLLEWPRLNSRFTVAASLKKIILRAIAGVILGLMVGAIVGVVLYGLAAFFGAQFNLVNSSLSFLIKRSSALWAIGVTILTVLAGTRENLFSANLKSVFRGALFGFMIGLSCGVIVYTIYYSFNNNYYYFITRLVNIIEDTIGTSIGCALIGAIFGGLTNKAAGILFADN